MKSTLEASFVPATSTRLRYSASSSRGPLSRRPRGAGVYFTTPGISRANADDAAAVMGLMWAECECAACEWPESAEEEDARRKGSKCSLRRSNSRESGAESSNLCNCAARTRQLSATLSKIGGIGSPASPVGFSNVISTSAESHLQ